MGQLKKSNMKISVVITAYNVAEYIAECLNSVLGQSYQRIEIIVVDDCSTDGTAEIVREYAGKYGNIRVIRNEENKGAGMSRRIGIADATGEYTMLLDGDDYIKNADFIRDLVETAEKTDADVVGGGITILKEDGSWDATAYGECITEGIEKVSRFWGERIVFMNNKLIRTSLYEKVPYCGRRYIEDTPVIIPILWHANKVAYVNNVGYTYRMRPASLTHTTTRVKEIIYKGLCWLDLMDFFEECDKAVLNAVNVRGYLSNIINWLNAGPLSEEEVKPFASDWQEFTRRLFARIQIANVNIKEKKEAAK